MLIDTHVHLQDPAYESDIEAVRARAARAGVLMAVVPASDLADSRRGLDLLGDRADELCELHAAVGVHPTNAHALTDEAVEELRQLASRPGVVAIGEIGLDYYWPRVQDRNWPCASPAQQREAFERQLSLASDLRLPAIIHDREAHSDLLDMIRAWRKGDPETAAVLHAYAGGPELLQEVLDLGLYIGMDGPVTYQKADDLHEVARHVPLDRLLLETDGPYLPPVPHRGERNEPAFLPYIAAQLAQLKSLPESTIAQATTENALVFFGL